MPPIGVCPKFKTYGKAPQGEAFTNDTFDVYQLGGLPGCFFEDLFAFVNRAVLFTPIDDGMFHPLVYLNGTRGQYQNGIEYAPKQGTPNSQFVNSVLIWNLVERTICSVRRPSHCLLLGHIFIPSSSFFSISFASVFLSEPRQTSSSTGCSSISEAKAPSPKATAPSSPVKQLLLSTT